MTEGERATPPAQWRAHDLHWLAHYNPVTRQMDDFTIGRWSDGKWKGFWYDENPSPALLEAAGWIWWSPARPPRKPHRDKLP